MTKDLHYYMSLNYEIRLKKYEDGWGATHPELLGVAGGGDTVEEALEMLEEAKELWFETLLAHGASIPEPEPERT
jgi:antitoxin HicB